MLLAFSKGSKLIKLLSFRAGLIAFNKNKLKGNKNEDFQKWYINNEVMVQIKISKLVHNSLKKEEEILLYVCNQDTKGFRIN